MSKTIIPWNKVSDEELHETFTKWLKSKEYHGIPIDILTRATMMSIQHKDLPADIFFTNEVHNMLIEIANRYFANIGVANEDSSKETNADS